VGRGLLAALAVSGLLLPAVALPADGADLCPAAFTSRSSGFTPSVAFAAAASGPAGDYEWRFGDGTAGVGTNPGHVYPGPGRYTVTLTVTTHPVGAAACTAATSAVVTADPVHRYAPEVRMHPRETRLPGDPNTFIDNSLLIWDRPDVPGAPPSCHDTVIAAGDASGADGRRAINKARLGTSSRPYGQRSSTAPHTRCVDGARVYANSPPAVVHKTKQRTDDGFVLDLRNTHSARAGDGLHSRMYAEYQPGTYVIYWLFYPYNDWKMKAGVLGLRDTVTERHEGDWEHITVRLDATGSATDVAYYQHSCSPDVVPYDAAEKTGTHPRVYAALGGHASYGTLGKGPLGPGVRLFPCLHGVPSSVATLSPEDRVGYSPRTTWRTWQNVGNARAQGWYGFGGSWGDRIPSTVANYGPAGPGPIRSRATGAVPSVWR
jgi:PKD repeat protein